MATPSRNGDRLWDTINGKPRRQNHGAVEKPPAIKIGGLESQPCAIFSSLLLL
ncbi:MAG: hypothetical protein WCD04_17220 [Terriglobia bacterium]